MFEIKPLQWSVGVVTAPRKDACYLPATLRSLSSCDFDNITIFAEPDSPLPSNFPGTIIKRPKTYGDWTNWATGLYELLLSNPDSDLFFMLEDDVILNKHCKQYIECNIKALGEFGSLSLYTPSHYNRRHFQGFHNQIEGHRTWSTVTVIMSREKVISFFSDMEVQSHRFWNTFGQDEDYWSCRKIDFKNSIKDAVIGRWATKNNLPVYYHSPSLAEHIGVTSTITDELASKENGRMSADFIGQETDITDWLGSPVNVRRFASIPMC